MVEVTVHAHYQVVGGRRVVLVEGVAKREELVGLLGRCISANQQEGVVLQSVRDTSDAV